MYPRTIVLGGGRVLTINPSATAHDIIRYRNNNQRNILFVYLNIFTFNEFLFFFLAHVDCWPRIGFSELYSHRDFSQTAARAIDFRGGERSALLNPRTTIYIIRDPPPRYFELHLCTTKHTHTHIIIYVYTTHTLVNYNLIFWYILRGNGLFRYKILK